MFKFDCSSLGPPYIFGRTHLEMFCPKDHILFMKIGFPSGHIKNQAIPLWGSKNKIVETPSSYLSKRVQKGQKANGKRIESIGCFVFEKNPKNTQNNHFFWKPVLSGGFLDFSQKRNIKLTQFFFHWFSALLAHVLIGRTMEFRQFCFLTLIMVWPDF